MVYFMENPMENPFYKWMMTAGTPIFWDPLGDCFRFCGSQNHSRELADSPMTAVVFSGGLSFDNNCPWPQAPFNTKFYLFQVLRWWWSRPKNRMGCINGINPTGLLLKIPLLVGRIPIPFLAPPQHRSLWVPRYFARGHPANKKSQMP